MERKSEYSASAFRYVHNASASVFGNGGRMRPVGPPSRQKLRLLSPRGLFARARSRTRFFETEAGAFLPRLGRKICLCCVRASKVPELFSRPKRPGVRVECRWPVITAREWGYYVPRHPGTTDTRLQIDPRLDRPLATSCLVAMRVALHAFAILSRARAECENASTRRSNARREQLVIDS